MMLVDRGLVVLDEPVTGHVRGCRMADGEDWRKITVRMLLNHSSGLPGAYFADIFTIFPAETSVGRKDEIKKLLG